MGLAIFFLHREVYKETYYVLRVSVISEKLMCCRELTESWRPVQSHPLPHWRKLCYFLLLSSQWLGIAARNDCPGFRRLYFTLTYVIWQILFLKHHGCVCHIWTIGVEEHWCPAHWTPMDIENKNTVSQQFHNFFSEAFYLYWKLNI